MYTRIALNVLTIMLVACASNSSTASSPGSSSEPDIKHSDNAGVVKTVKLKVGGRTRRYLSYSPKSLKNNTQKRALVIVLHGGGGTAKQIVRNAGKSFFRLAEEDGFYVVFPDAVNKIWDFGAGKISESLEEKIDDRSFFEAVINDVIARLPIDETRIFATGISRGGQASYFHACEFPNRIRAIAPIAMPLPNYMLEKCREGPPVGIAIINGTADPIVPYHGGAITIGKKKRDVVLGTNETVQLWNQRNTCNPVKRKNSIINPAKDRMRVKLTEWRDCESPVLLYSIIGGGHTWPSGKQKLPVFLVGRVNKDIDGAEVAWGFFKEFD